MNKKVSFDEIQKKFLNPNSDASEEQTAANSGSSDNVTDESHFRFDANDPSAVLIAGSSGGSGSCAKASAAGSATSGGGDGACASGAGGASSCDSGSAGAGGS